MRYSHTKMVCLHGWTFGHLSIKLSVLTEGSQVTKKAFPFLSLVAPLTVTCAGL